MGKTQKQHPFHCVKKYMKAMGVKHKEAKATFIMPCHVVCRLVNLLTQLELQKALGPPPSMGGHFLMKDCTPDWHEHTPTIPTSYFLWSQAGEEGRRRLVYVHPVEFQERQKSTLCFLPVMTCLKLQGALFTDDGTPEAAESPNCLTASLSCVIHSLWTSISLTEKN